MGEFVHGREEHWTSRSLSCEENHFPQRQEALWFNMKQLAQRTPASDSRLFRMRLVSLADVSIAAWLLTKLGVVWPGWYLLLATVWQLCLFSLQAALFPWSQPTVGEAVRLSCSSWTLAVGPLAFCLQMSVSNRPLGWLTVSYNNNYNPQASN